MRAYFYHILSFSLVSGRGTVTRARFEHEMLGMAKQYALDCYAPSPYLRTNQESKSTTVLQMQEGSLFISSALGPKSHPTQGNLTRAPNKGVSRLIYRQFFVSVTGVAGVT